MPPDAPAGAPGAPAGAPGDPLDEVITLAQAARLSGLAAHTLTLQAERGKLRARKVGHTWITTPHWLAVYLATHARRRREGPTGPQGPQAPQGPAGRNAPGAPAAG